MNIALLITGLGMGGAERQVVDLADRFASLDHNILIIYLTGEAIVLPSNPSIRVIGMNMSKTPWSFLTTYRRIRSLIQSFKPDILHSHMVHANIIARLLRLSIRIPRLICTAHNTNEGGTLRMWLYRVTDP
ncbi:MAG: glycosyltransferase, partial [Campylobacterales bacterium]|nr:glycosyltransferase [Campylobacterales bacterium]